MKSVGLFLIFELGLLGIELYLRGRQVRLLYGLPGCAKDLSASADTDVREDRAVYFFFFLFLMIFFFTISFGLELFAFDKDFRNCSFSVFNCSISFCCSSSRCFP